MIHLDNDLARGVFMENLLLQHLKPMGKLKVY